MTSVTHLREERLAISYLRRFGPIPEPAFREGDGWIAKAEEALRTGQPVKAWKDWKPEEGVLYKLVLTRKWYGFSIGIWG